MYNFFHVDDFNKNNASEESIKSDTTFIYIDY